MKKDPIDSWLDQKKNNQINVESAKGIESGWSINECSWSNSCNNL